LIIYGAIPCCVFLGPPSSFNSSSTLAYEAHCFSMLSNYEAIAEE